MTVSSFLALLLAGKLLTWFLMVSGPTRRLWRIHSLLRELGSCDLCLGFWVYLLLFAMEGSSFLGILPLSVETILLAAISSFGMHLFSLGWQAKYSQIVMGVSNE